MSDERKHPFGAATPAGRDAATCSRAGVIRLIIPSGRENAIHLETLSGFLGCSPSAVKRAIKTARMNGAPIMSSAAGYWKAATDAEIREFVEAMRGQAFSRLMVARRMRENVEAEKL